MAVHIWWVHLYECGSGAASYESEGKLSREFMKTQVGCMAETRQIENLSKDSQEKGVYIQRFMNLVQDLVSPRICKV